ncbi:hypothetical protein CEXT_232031 [Caerostris extrusa]|uniref:Uncharacterized protein n=1 Tax=Caerostris extrusa TaxID=172846 RepID=A0AAV4Y3P8_CAEEX|nr:hypothetical protein CEXT_232031 [Caerostris extrusa]
MTIYKFQHLRSHVSCVTDIFFLFPKSYKSSESFGHIHHFTFFCSTARICSEEFHNGNFTGKTEISFQIALAVLLVIQYASAMGLGGGLGGGFGGGYGMGILTFEITVFGSDRRRQGLSQWATRPVEAELRPSGVNKGTAAGGVRGSYGYRDAQGLYRMVEYSAGQGDSRPLSDQRTWYRWQGEPC